MNTDISRSSDRRSSFLTIGHKARLAGSHSAWISSNTDISRSSDRSSSSAGFSTNTDIPRWSDTILKTPGRHGSEAIEKRGLKQAFVSHHWFPGTLQAGRGYHTQNTRTHKPYIQQDGTAADKYLNTGFQENTRPETGQKSHNTQNTGRHRSEDIYITGHGRSKQDVLQHWFPGTQQVGARQNTQNTPTAQIKSHIQNRTRLKQTGGLSTLVSKNKSGQNRTQHSKHHDGFDQKP